MGYQKNPLFVFSARGAERNFEVLLWGWGKELGKIINLLKCVEILEGKTYYRIFPPMFFKDNISSPPSRYLIPMQCSMQKVHTGQGFRLRVASGHEVQRNAQYNHCQWDELPRMVCVIKIRHEQEKGGNGGRPQNKQNFRI